MLKKFVVSSMGMGFEGVRIGFIFESSPSILSSDDPEGEFNNRRLGVGVDDVAFSPSTSGLSECVFCVVSDDASVGLEGFESFAISELMAVSEGPKSDSRSTSKLVCKIGDPGGGASASRM